MLKLCKDKTENPSEIETKTLGILMATLNQFTSSFLAFFINLPWIGEETIKSINIERRYRVHQSKRCYQHSQIQSTFMGED